MLHDRPRGDTGTQTPRPHTPTTHRPHHTTRMDLLNNRRNRRNGSADEVLTVKPAVAKDPRLGSAHYAPFFVGGGGEKFLNIQPLGMGYTLSRMVAGFGVESNPPR